MSYDGSKVVLSVVPLVDYSEDEEWDKTQMDFSIEKRLSSNKSFDMSWYRKFKKSSCNTSVQ